MARRLLRLDAVPRRRGQPREGAGDRGAARAGAGLDARFAAAGVARHAIARGAPSHQPARALALRACARLRAARRGVGMGSRHALEGSGPARPVLSSLATTSPTRPLASTGPHPATHAESTLSPHPSSSAPPAIPAGPAHPLLPHKGAKEGGGAHFGWGDGQGGGGGGEDVPATSAPPPPPCPSHCVP